MKLSSPYLVRPHSKVKLSQVSPRDHGKYSSHKEALADTQKHVQQLAELQQVFAASASRSLLVVLQAMDAGGKDGTIRHIFSGVNPQGCDVSQFKVPTALEAAHDFLWRVHERVPAKGKIGIFNRSHYEDVLITRVHGTISRKEEARRWEEIVRFEQMLSDNGTTILKFFLHISREEQTARLKARLDTPDKRWKLSASDFSERKFWPQYQEAYQETIAATSRKHAPWFVIPSDHKWYRNVTISKVLVQALQGMKLKYPGPAASLSTYKL